MKIGIKLAAFFGMLVGGHYMLRLLFRYIASVNVREVFTAASLLLVLGAALFMDFLGLPMALGMFITGVLLAESEYRHELEIAIEPFKRAAAGAVFHFGRYGAESRHFVCARADGTGRGRHTGSDQP